MTYVLLSCFCYFKSLIISSPDYCHSWQLGHFPLWLALPSDAASLASKTSIAAHELHVKVNNHWPDWRDTLPPVSLLCVCSSSLTSMCSSRRELRPSPDRSFLLSLMWEGLTTFTSQNLYSFSKAQQKEFSEKMSPTFHSYFCASSLYVS